MIELICRTYTAAGFLIPGGLDPKALSCFPSALIPVKRSTSKTHSSRTLSAGFCLRGRALPTPYNWACFHGYKMGAAGAARDEGADGRGAAARRSVPWAPCSPPGLTVSWLLEVDVGVAQRAAGGHVAAHADGQDGPRGRELVEEHGLGHVRV